MTSLHLEQTWLRASRSMGEKNAKNLIRNFESCHISSHETNLEMIREMIELNINVNVRIL